MATNPYRVCFLWISQSPYFVAVVHCQVVCNSLWPCDLQDSRLTCPSVSPRVCSNSCPLHLWCYPTISSSTLPQAFLVPWTECLCLPKIHMWKLKCSLWWYLELEPGGVKAFMVALVPLRRRERKALSSSLTLFTVTPSNMWPHSKKTDVCKPEKGSHQYLAFLIIPDLELSASRTMRHAYRWLKPTYSVCSSSWSYLLPHPRPSSPQLWLLSPSV